MKIRFWGVRGSIPAPGPETIRYGGNTSCVSVDDRVGRRSSSSTWAPASCTSATR